jgi:glucose-1-phosphate thymidylyltransferase
MTAVILAGGRGSRFRDITKIIPKPLIAVAGKPLIYYVFDALPKEISKCVIIIGHLGHLIKEKLGDAYKNITISYVNQISGGTGGALMSAKYFLRHDSSFMVVGSDDIFGKGELSKLITEKNSYGVFYGLSNKPISHQVVFDDKNIFLGFETIKDFSAPCHFGVGAYVLGHSFFSQELHKLPNGEFSIPHTFINMREKIKVVHIKKWIPVNNFFEKEKAEAYFAKRKV